MVGQRERRAHPRYKIDWPVLLHDKRSGSRVAGRGRNLSRGGALVALPLSIPLRKGQEVQMHFPPREPVVVGEAAAPPDVRNAHVVRVHRSRTLHEGLQLVGLSFDGT